MGGRSEYINKLVYNEADGMCGGDRTSRGGQGLVEVKLLCFR